MKEVDRLDEALAEHYRTGDYVPLGMATQDNWPTVRQELQRLREERDAAQRMADHMVTLDGPNAWAIANAERHRAEAAEAEVQRYREGLRESNALLQQMLEHMEFAHYPQTGDGPHLADPIDLMEKARALLSEKPDGGGAGVHSADPTQVTPEMMHDAGRGATAGGGAK